MNRVDRLLAEIVFLQSKRVVTADEMAAHFHLSVRTIYRDLTALGEAGIPLVSEAGIGYSLMKGYYLPPVNFTADEANALSMGGMLVSQFADQSIRHQMEAALRKIRAVLPPDNQDRLVRLERCMTTTAMIPMPPQVDLGLLQQALANRRLLSFRYQGVGQGRSKERIVEPMGLVHYLQRWHLLAWCRLRNDYRDFRTDRMTDLLAYRETFTPRDDVHVNQLIRMTMPAANLEAEIFFSVKAADRAMREWWHGVTNEVVRGDGVVLTLATPDWAGLVHWLLSFGSTAVVISPQEAIDTLLACAKDLLDHHQAHLKHYGEIGAS